MPIILLLVFLSCASVARAEAPETSGDAARQTVAAPEAAAVSDVPDVDALAVPDALDETGRVDLYCLRRSYPRIKGLESASDGLWLVFDDGRRVLYAAASEAVPAQGAEPAWVVDVRQSMAEPYPLDPDRPDTPLGISPGRRRSYDLLQTLYGTTPRAVGAHLRQAHLMGQSLHLAQDAAAGMNRANAALAPQIAADPRLRPLLKMDGGFSWRRIAGENRLSPHAFGIAFDISPGIATYWRWSKLRPHPMQKSYPSVIVEAFENQGFIWGGKWHEYDLMHFEYRPEIICKARLMKGLEKMPSGLLQGASSDRNAPPVQEPDVQQAAPAQ